MKASDLQNEQWEKSHRIDLSEFFGMSDGAYVYQRSQAQQFHDVVIFTNTNNILSFEVSSVKYSFLVTSELSVKAEARPPPSG